MTPYELMVDLAACIEVTFEAEGRPAPCFNGVVPGDGVTSAWFSECDDDGPCGMTWVRMVTAYPSETIGLQSTKVGNCAVGMGFDFEVGVLRCTEVDLPDDAVSEQADALAETGEIIADMMALRKAILCCTSIPTKDSILGGWSPMGPLGGMVGGAWMLYAGLL